MSGPAALEPLEPRLLLAANPVITEFMASNRTTLIDGSDPGRYADWIEIHNHGDAAIDLAGWHLTDNSGNLTKWTFGPRVLDAGEYLIVFASGNDAPDDAGNLHTNFRLDADGEYLALIRPDLSIASEFGAGGANYPVQFEDVSYGIAVAETLTPLITVNDSVRYAVAGSAAAGNWLDPLYDDGAWSVGLNGVGYNRELPPPGFAGFLSNMVRVTGMSIESTTIAEDIMSRADGMTGVHGPYNIVQDVRHNIGVIDYAGGAGTFTANNPYPNGTSGEGNEQFVMRAVTEVTIPEGVWQIAFGTDDGGRLILSNATFQSRFGTSGSQPATNQIRFEPVRGHAWTGGTFTVPAGGGPVTMTLDALMFERTGGDTFEIAIRDASSSESFTPSPANGWVLLGDGALGWALNAELSGGGAGGGDEQGAGAAESTRQQITAYESLIRTDVEADLFGVGSGLLVRIPFNVADLTAFDSLRLRMKYDDGFVAYINGFEVARSNAPDPLVFDSAALSTRSKAQAIVYQDIPLSIDVTSLLSEDVGPGDENVLAIHLLNADASDDDVLLVAELLGVRVDSSAERYFSTPTPGEANGQGFFDFVAEVQASHPRGFYDAPFNVTLSTPTADATIRYTLNGTEPTLTNGLTYTTPLAINRTTTLRAAAFKTDHQPSEPVTHTYIFLDNILVQDYAATLAAGFPASWGGTTPDYGMDSNVIGPNDLFGGVYAATIRDDLLAVPTLSIVMDINDMFGPNGIYTNSSQSGIAWERATSVELIQPDGSPGFALDAGIRIQGGAFRSHGLTRKHSLRLLFKDDYGPTKLQYPLFGENAADEFDTITLRMESNDGWQWSSAGAKPQYARDMFGRLTQIDMGHAGSHGTYLHVYINGVYWGIYNASERPDAAFASTYYGGDKGEWDAINSGEAVDGNLNAWNTMLALANNVAIAPTEQQRTAAFMAIQGLNPDGSDNPALENYLDVANLIDYMIVNLYGGNSDWPFKNYYTARERGPDSTGFKFFMWDAEWSLNLQSSLTTNQTGVSTGVAIPYDRLRASAEFRQLFGDHLHRHFFNGGALYVDPLNPQWDPAHPERNVPAARYVSILQQIEQAIVAESARWGDQHREPPYTKADWQNEANDLLSNYFPQRSAIVLQQFRTAGLYPTVVAPLFNQHGGVAPGGFELVMTAPTGVIYYTLDGSDPRLIGGAISPDALIFQGSNVNTTLIPRSSQWRYLDNGSNQGDAWRNPVFNDSAWAAGNAQLGYGDGDEATIVSFGPSSSNKYITTYFRRHFTVNNVDDITSLTLDLLRDDGAVVYLNGVEVVRSNMPGGTISFTTPATTAVGGADESTFYSFAIDPALLVEGDNVIAVELHQSGGGSSDLSFDLELRSTAVSVSVPLHLLESGVVKARAYDGGQWSALNEAAFTINDPATANNLAVTEINYNPPAPTAEELALDPTLGNDDFEFIELRNIGSTTLDLAGVTFTDGIRFDFSTGAIRRLEPGQFVLIVEDSAAFQIRYGSAFAERIAGQYSGNLSNGGEHIELQYRGSVIHSFTYDDASPWPTEPDGGGPTLTLINPAVSPNNPANWRPSHRPLGSPGEIDTVIGDFDDDGLVTHADIDLLAAAIRNGSDDDRFDLTGDNLVSAADMDRLIHVVLNTEYGDANLDGVVGITDLTILAIHFTQAARGWAGGDFNGDGFTNIADLSRLASHFGFAAPAGAGDGQSSVNLLDEAAPVRRRPLSRVVTPPALTAPPALGQPSCAWAHIDSLLV